MTAGIIAMILLVTLMIFFIKPGDARELERRELEKDRKKARAHQLAINTSYKATLEALAAMFDEPVLPNFTKHSLTVDTEPRSTKIHVVSVQAASARLRLVVHIPHNTPLHRGLVEGRLNEEAWRSIGLESLFTRTRYVTYIEHGFIEHNLAVVIDFARPFRTIATLCRELVRHVSVTNDVWPGEHRARIVREQESWHAAHASMNYLIDSGKEDPVYLERYSHHALLAALEHMQRVRPEEWFGKTQRQHLRAALCGVLVDPMAKLAMLEFMCDHDNHDPFWEDPEVEDAVARLASAHPDQDISALMLIFGHSSPQGLTMILLSMISHIRTRQDMSTRFTQIIDLPWAAESREVLPELGADYDEEVYMMALGILSAHDPEFTRRARTWLATPPPQGTALFMWREIVHARCDELAEQHDFVEMLVELITDEHEHADLLVDILLPDFATSPHLVTALRAHVHTRRAYSRQEWDRLGKHVLDHVPLHDDDTCAFLFDFAMKCPDKAQREAFFRGIDPDDTRYMAFQIQQEIGEPTRRIYLAQKLAGLGALPLHAIDALLHMIEHDKRPSIYKPLLERLGKTDSARALTRLELMGTQRAHARAKREHIATQVDLIRERIGMHGGELTLSEAGDPLRGGLSESPD